MTSIGELSTGARSERRTCAGSHSVAGASSQLALVSSSDGELGDRLPGGVAVEPADMRLVGHLSGPIEAQDVRPVAVRSRPPRSRAGRERRSTISTTSPAAGAAGVMGFSLTSGCIGALAAGVEHFFRRWVRIPCHGEADARSRLCDGDRKRRGAAARRARRPARAGRHRRPRRRGARGGARRIGVPRRCRGSRRFAGIRRRRGARRSAASTTSGRTSACRSAARWSRRAPADFDRSFAINVRAHAVVCGAAVPHLRAAGGGAICITASNSALLSEPQLAPYAVTKAAALALARQVARDYSSEGIRVNALCPGWIDTPFNTPAWENFGGRERFLTEVPRLVPAGAHRHGRGGGPAGVLPALGRRRVHDRPCARRRRRRVPARLSPTCAATRTTASSTRCRRGTAFRSASTRCCARARPRSRASRCTTRARPRARSCCSRTRPTGSRAPSAAS